MVGFYFKKQQYPEANASGSYRYFSFFSPIFRSLP